MKRYGFFEDDYTSSANRVNMNIDWKLLQVMSDQHSQALSTPPAPLEAGSRKRSGLFVTVKMLFSALCMDALDYYRRPRGRSVSYSIRRYCRRGVI